MKTSSTKNILSVILLWSFLALAAGCESFLDVKPKESLSDHTTIVDKISSETAINGVYSALASGSYYGTTFQSIAYLSGDNIQWTGSQSQVQEFINHRVNPENSTIGSAWTAIYNVINRANNVIAKVPEVEDPALTSEVRNGIIGQALAIRGLAYFDLARTYGGVPIITNPTITPDDNRGISKTSQQETFLQALADLEAAEPLLEDNTNRYKVRKKTVLGLKARYYLYQKDYLKAVEYASLILADNNYQLVQPYAAFFKDNVRGTEESIFEIYYNGTTEVNGHRGQWQPQNNGGTRQWAPNEELISLLNDPEIGGNRRELIDIDNQGRWYGNLYYRNPGSDPSYILRVAEIYLIRAEARAHLNDLQGALEDLNAVRNRAGLASLQSNSQEEILLSIENERRLEFALEPHRWFDLVRTGRAAEVLNITEPFRFVMPIPIDQLLADDALVQNDGY